MGSNRDMDKGSLYHEIRYMYMRVRYKWSRLYWDGEWESGDFAHTCSSRVAILLEYNNHVTKCRWILLLISQLIDFVLVGVDPSSWSYGYGEIHPLAEVLKWAAKILVDYGHMIRTGSRSRSTPHENNAQNSRVLNAARAGMRSDHLSPRSASPRLWQMLSTSVLGCHNTRRSTLRNLMIWKTTPERLEKTSKHAMIWCMHRMPSL